jgi:hypothetical protein
MWQSSVLAVLAAAAILIPAIGQVRADDVETAKSNARIQISGIERELGELRAKILIADSVLAGARAALKKEQNQNEPDVGKVIALTLAVGAAEEVKRDLETQKAVKEAQLREWKLYLGKLGG